MSNGEEKTPTMNDTTQSMKKTGSAGSISDAQDYPDCEEPAPTCDHCGGDGCIDYLDGDGGDWGEDSPSEENHLIICRHCGGTGYAR